VSKEKKKKSKQRENKNKAKQEKLCKDHVVIPEIKR
jgi:hypothetical protein